MSRSSPTPRVSVGVPVYNGEPYLTEALGSILAQSLEDLQVVVSDNASTDGTEEICRDLAAHDARVTYVRNRENLGFVHNFNHVFRLSRGRYFKWAAADDVIEPDFLLRCVEVLDRDATVVLAHPWTIPIDAEGQRIHGKSVHPGVRGDRHPLTEYSNTDSAYSAASRDPVLRFRRLMEDIWYTPQLYGVIRADALARTRLHPNHRMGDHILLAELVLHGRFHEVPEPLFLRRYHEAQITEADDALAQLRLSLPDPTRSASLLDLVRAYPHRLLLHIEGVRRAPLTSWQRTRCYAVIARTVLQWGLLRARQAVHVAWERLVGSRQAPV